MAEYRIHWKEKGKVMYSWHKCRSEAYDELVAVRKRLDPLGHKGASEFGEIVRFDIQGSRIRELLEFLNEHVNEGPSCAA